MKQIRRMAREKPEGIKEAKIPGPALCEARGPLLSDLAGRRASASTGRERLSSASSCWTHAVRCALLSVQPSFGQSASLSFALAYLQSSWCLPLRNLFPSAYLRDVTRFQW